MKPFSTNSKVHSESISALFLSFLAYQSEADITILNTTRSLWPSAWEEWAPVWEQLKPHFVSSFEVFSCSDYNIGDTDTQFVYATIRRDCKGGYEDELIIAFRGTKTVRDVLTDVRVDKDKCTDICYTPLYLREERERKTKSGVPMVHSGFHEMYGVMKYALFDVVQRHLRDEKQPIHQLTLTGHSLGGAVSILATPCLLYGLNGLGVLNTTPMSVRVSNITFGSPKVGNWDFSVLCNRLVEKHAVHAATHYFHNSDPVPCLPMLSGFYACNNAVQINSTNESRFYSIRFHLIECYLKHLKHLSIICSNEINTIS